MAIEYVNQTANETALNVTKRVAEEGDIFSLIGSIITNPIFLIVSGFLIGALITFVIYHFFWKKDEKLVFEFEKFEDIVHDDLKGSFELEGIKTTSSIVHGINNPIGKIEMWFKKQGEWSVMEYDRNRKEYVIKEVPVKVVKTNEQGEAEKDKKGNVVHVIQKQPLKIPYDIHVFKIKSNSWFGDPKYIIADSKYVNFDTLGKRWQLEPNVSLRSFGKCWITSEIGEHYLQDISFRRSLENNLTFLMNQSRKVIFLETAFAQKNELMIGKGIAKKLAYDQYAQSVLMTAGKQGESEEDET
jgi:hypothetical protein